MRPADGASTKPRLDPTPCRLISSPPPPRKVATVARVHYLMLGSASVATSLSSQLRRLGVPHGTGAPHPVPLATATASTAPAAAGAAAPIAPPPPAASASDGGSADDAALSLDASVSLDSFGHTSSVWTRKGNRVVLNCRRIYFRPEAAAAAEGRRHPCDLSEEALRRALALQENEPLSSPRYRVTPQTPSPRPMPRAVPPLGIVLWWASRPPAIQNTLNTGGVGWGEGIPPDFPRYT